MAQLTVEQRKVIVEEMIKDGSVTATIRRFQARYGKGLCKRTVQINYAKWNAHGTVQNLNKGNSGPPKAVRTETAINMVRNLINDDKTKSVRKLSVETQIKNTSVYLILKKELHLKPYKMQCRQELSAQDKERRLAFCRRLKNMSISGQVLLNNIIFSDECHIYLKGAPNRHNYRNWSSAKPNDFFEKPLHSPKITVWCGLSGHKIYGPYFFEDPATEHPQTINSNTYLEMLKTILSANTHPDEWYQQDGATAHTSRDTMSWLKDRFHHRLISHKSDFPWPARSPDLSPLDFFLWGFVKGKVFRSAPSNIGQLKNEVREIIESIDADTLQNVIANFAVRLDKCIESGGGHVEC